VVFSIATRLQHEQALVYMHELQTHLAAGRALLENETGALVQTMHSVFPPHVLAMCVDLALKEQRTAGHDSALFDSADNLLFRHLADVAAPFFAEQLHSPQSRWNWLRTNLYPPFLELYLVLQRLRRRQHSADHGGLSYAIDVVGDKQRLLPDPGQAVVDKDLFFLVRTSVIS
jgi:hypothetical protein